MNKVKIHSLGRCCLDAVTHVLTLLKLDVFPFFRVLEDSQRDKQLLPEARGRADQGGKEEDCRVRGSTEGKAVKTAESDDGEGCNLTSSASQSFYNCRRGPSACVRWTSR